MLTGSIYIFRGHRFRIPILRMNPHERSHLGMISVIFFLACNSIWFLQICPNCTEGFHNLLWITASDWFHLSLMTQTTITVLLYVFFPACAMRHWPASVCFCTWLLAWRFNRWIIYRHHIWRVFIARIQSTSSSEACKCATHWHADTLTGWVYIFGGTDSAFL